MIKRDPKIFNSKGEIIDFGPSKAVQSLEKETNINQIVKRMEKGQMLDTLRDEGRFEDVSEFNGLADAIIKVQNANNMFMELPAEVREKFGHNPVKLIDFLADDKNRKEAEDLGLVNPKPPKAGEPATIPPASGEGTAQ